MISYLVNNILPAVEHFGVLAYWIGFAAALLETTIGIGMLLPGSLVVLWLGTLTARGSLDAGDLVWFAFFGAFIGDNLNYFLGRRYGAAWLSGGVWLLKPEHFRKARDFFEKHGARSILLGRFLPSVKEIVPLIAGIVGMRRRTFLFWNVLGSIGWALEMVFIGYFFGQSLKMAQLWFSRAGLLAAAILVISGMLYVLKHLLIRRGKGLFAFMVSIFTSIRKLLLDNEQVAAWMGRHPGIVAFCRSRLDISSFTGLPLTILVLTFMYVLALLGGLVEDLISSDPIVSVDISLANLMPLARTGGLTDIFTWLTLLGKWQVVLTFLVATISLMWLWHQRLYIVPLLLTILGSQLFSWLGKLAFRRPRPTTALYREYSFSFPSGHAVIALAFYGFLAYLLIRATPDWKKKVNRFFAGLAIILAIGLSRIYLGVHFLSDVWGGYLVGGLWLISGITLAEWRRHRSSATKRAAPALAARPLSVGAIAAALLFYAGFGYRYHPPPAFTQPPERMIVADAASILAGNGEKFTETVLGQRQEPLNFIFIARDDINLMATFQEAGWQKADRPDWRSLSKTLQAMVLKRHYSVAPVAPSFWDGRVQDFSFTVATEEHPFGHARHVRVWRTDALSTGGDRYYVGLANATAGLEWGLMPRIAPDLDQARAALKRDIDRTGKAAAFRMVQLVPPQTGQNFAGQPFFTDGKAWVVTLR